ncbi:MAG: MBL fold metallo-hydrolase [Dehalococcoidia bacterium]|jgi:glyoxylase-like metal-dependent hydrolase (beta-lactamase superfamily II)
MTEVYNGIHWIKLPMTPDNSNRDNINIYLIRGKDGYLLVDSGWNTDISFSKVHNYLIKNNLRFGDISQIVVTHSHPDHYGMAGRIRELSGATLAMHHLEDKIIESRYVQQESLLQETGRMLEDNGLPYEEMKLLRDASLEMTPFIMPVHSDLTLHDGDTISTGEFNFRVFWTPGHSAGHVCLYEPDKKILLSGDHILPRITPNISVHPQSIENPLGRYLESLKEIRNLDVELTLPGHDEPFGDPTARIDTIIEHHIQRNLEILTALQQDTRNTYQIARELPWGTGSRYTDLPDFHKRMAVFETLAHIEMMTNEGNLDILPGKGVKYYRQR